MPKVQVEVVKKPPLPRTDPTPDIKPEPGQKPAGNPTGDPSKPQPTNR